MLTAALLNARLRFFGEKAGVLGSATLVARQKLNHNTYIFTFDTQRRPVRLPVGKHMQLVAEGVTGTTVQRAYTPTAVYENAFDLLVKVYRPNERFPKGGAMSQYLEQLAVGAEIRVKGPVGRMEYLGSGEFELMRPHTSPTAVGTSAGPLTNPAQFPAVRKTFKHVAMVAGGTGITPMYQVIKAVEAEKGKGKGPTLSLIYGNQTPDDILLQRELETLAENKTVAVTLTVDRAIEGWKGLVGVMDQEKLVTNVPAPSDDTLVLICGPPMMNKVVRDTLEKLGHQWIHVF